MESSLARGIISDHFSGVGTVTPAMVRHRAREIAIINGRPSNHCTKQDFLEAQRELTGAISAMDGEDETLITAASWGEEPVSAGHPVEKEEPLDEQTITEQLVEQGISEAEHDQMVEAARTRQIL